MISATALLVIKTILMIVILSAMALLLFGVGHIFDNDDLNSMEDDKKLRRDLKEKENVISNKSIFSNFLVRNCKVAPQLKSQPVKRKNKQEK